MDNTQRGRQPQSKQCFLQRATATAAAAATAVAAAAVAACLLWLCFASFYFIEVGRAGLLAVSQSSLHNLGQLPAVRLLLGGRGSSSQ